MWLLFLSPALYQQRAMTCCVLLPSWRSLPFFGTLSTQVNSITSTDAFAVISYDTIDIAFVPHIMFQDTRSFVFLCYYLLRRRIRRELDILWRSPGAVTGSANWYCIVYFSLVEDDSVWPDFYWGRICSSEYLLTLAGSCFAPSSWCTGC